MTEQEIEELRKERDLYKQILDLIPDDVFVKDRESRFRYANAATRRTLGATKPEDYIGKNDYDIMPTPEIAEKYIRIERGIMENDAPVINEIFSDINEHGIRMWASTSKIPLKDEQGNVLGLLGISRDLTSLKTAEERQREQQKIIEVQREQLRELSTPIIPLFNRIIIVPLIGDIDTERAREITRALLAGIGQHRAKIVIMDITGVPVVDSGVADDLNRTIQAARLKGAKTIITGISDAVAETIIDLGIDWRAITTLRDLQSGVMVALEEQGMTLTGKP